MAYAFFLNCKYSPSEMMRIPISRVLSPILENLFSSSSRFSLFSLLRRALMMLSAPFVYILIIPLLLTTTDILFRSDVKGKTYSSWKVRVYAFFTRISVRAWVDLMN